MLLIPYKVPFLGKLHLDAFSFRNEEINSVSIVLNKALIKFNTKYLIEDKQGRIGKQFIIASFEVRKVEKFLNIKFIGFGKSTAIKLPKETNGQSYKCQRVDTPPHDCETIFADNNHIAIVKCALVANSNNWLGGIPIPGQC
jgi:hypothetical protein